MIWLASFPRSGNTFFRIVLREVYGIQSSTFHYEKEYPVDSHYETYAVVKTHLLPSEIVPSNPEIPAIYLVRDGRDALVSIAHHRSDLIAPGSDYRQNLREAIVASEGSFFGGWSHNVEEWSKRAALVIRFEDLIRDPIKYIEKIRPWVKLPFPRTEKLPTFKELKQSKIPSYGAGKDRGFSNEKMIHRQTLFFRRGVIGAWRDEMPEDLQDLFWDLHGPTMKRLGYPREESVAKQFLRSIKKICIIR